MPYRILAGYGGNRSLNWGFDHKEAARNAVKWIEDCKPYIGKPVMLAGGGGNGCYPAILVSVKLAALEWRKTGDVYAYVELSGECPQKQAYLGSWQLWVEE